MIKPPIPDNEVERQKAVESYSILDTIPEKDLDDLTAIAAEICKTPITLISIVDKNRQWFKSKIGLEASETPREYSFCAHAICDADNIMIVQDARLDPRFQDNPLVTGDPNIIFYAGVPLISDNGLPLGTLCVIDKKPRVLTQTQLDSLSALSRQIVTCMQIRKNRKTLEKTMGGVLEKNQALEQFAFIAAHDIKSPLQNISILSKLFLEEYGNKFDQSGRDMLGMIEKSSEKLKNLVDGLLEYSRSESILQMEKVTIDLTKMTTEITNLFAFDHHVNIELESVLSEIYNSRTALEQILINLLSNAIKYNDQDVAAIQIGISEKEGFYSIYVQDNGPGISPKDHQKLFKIFEVIAPVDKFGQKGNGLGLAIVKKLVKTLGGSITVDSDLGKGARFTFLIPK